MSSESVCQVARSWVDVGSFHKRLVVRFMNFTASVRNILDTPSYMLVRSGFVRGSLLQIYNKCGHANEDQKLKQRWKPKLIPLIQINNIQISYGGKYTFDIS
jgi:hypothetical protein